MAVNEITGDSLRSRPATKAYSDNYDSIFRKKPTENPVGVPEVTSNKPMESTKETK